MKLINLRATSLGATLVIGLALLVAACDTVDVGGFDLPNRRVTFEFRFQGGDLDPGSLNTILSNNEVDLTDYLRSHGFDTSDVIAARVVSGSAEMRVARPLAASVSHIDEIQVRHRQGGRTGALMVSGSDFTGTGSAAPLSIASVNLGPVVAGGVFEAEMQIQPDASLVLDQEYRLEIIFDVVIEVEG